MAAAAGAGAGEAAAAAAAGAGEPERLSEGVKTIQAIQAAIVKDMAETPSFKRKLILMIGGADFFSKNSRLRENPYELRSLLQYLDNEETQESDVVYNVLCFDEAYTAKNVENDVEHANIHVTSLHPSLETNSFIVREALSSNGLFTFIKMNLETDYKDFAGRFPTQKYWNGKTLVKTMADNCVPKEGSVMEALQTLCREIPFKEYILYNCAWIKGTRFYTNKNTGIQYVNQKKQNRHFELMCELLYIFMNLGRPAYLFTAKDMNVFVHEGQIKPARLGFLNVTPLNVTPLNETTMFALETWNPTTGGTRRKARKTHKTKHSRKH